MSATRFVAPQAIDGAVTVGLAELKPRSVRMLTRLCRQYPHLQTAAALAGLLVLGSASAESALTGVASVIDGDTIEVHGERIRFGGIDAPEARQVCQRNGEEWRCGQAASQALDQWIGGKTVRCETTNKDQYGRWIAECFRQDQSISRWLVRRGWALDWPRYSDGKFGSEQQQARADERGIWASEFIKPWAWRHQR